MRVIIIENKDAQSLLDKLKLTAEEKSLPFENPDKSLTFEAIHGAFRSTVVQWLEDQGCPRIGKMR